MKRNTIVAVVAVLAAALFLLATATKVGANDKVTICHHANDECWVTIEVATEAIPAHEAHGDIIGQTCDEHGGLPICGQQ